MAAATADHCALPDLPIGTIIPVVRDAKRWWVRGRSGWYICHQDTGECSCPSSQFRRGMCRHAAQLKAIIDAQKALAEVAPITVARTHEENERLKEVFR